MDGKRERGEGVFGIKYSGKRRVQIGASRHVHDRPREVLAAVSLYGVEKDLRVLTQQATLFLRLLLDFDDKYNRYEGLPNNTIRWVFNAPECF